MRKWVCVCESALHWTNTPSRAFSMCLAPTETLIQAPVPPSPPTCLLKSTVTFCLPSQLSSYQSFLLPFSCTCMHLIIIHRQMPKDGNEPTLIWMVCCCLCTRLMFKVPSAAFMIRGEKSTTWWWLFYLNMSNFTNRKIIKVLNRLNRLFWQKGGKKNIALEQLNI